MNAARSRDRRTQKPHRDCGGTKNDDSVGEEHRPNSRNAADEAERRAGEAEREVQKCGVRAHREASALRRCAPQPPQ